MQHTRGHFSAIISCLCLMAMLLCGCGASADSLSSLADRFSEQASVVCSLERTITLETVQDGATVILEQTLTAEAQLDLTRGGLWVSGTLTALEDGEEVSSVEVEDYGDSEGWYRRYGDLYLYGQTEDAFLTYLRAPEILSLSSGYVRSSATELLGGSTCSVYTGTEIADGSGQSAFLGQSERSFSLAGCLIDVTLYVYEDIGLPARIQMDYAELEELGVAFSDEDGNSYTVTSLHCEIDYDSYGTEVDVTVPETFRQAALESAASGTDETEDGSEVEEQQTDDDTSSSKSVVHAAEGDYQISDAAGLYFYAIDTPEHMALETSDAGSVSFYYYYAEDDFEIVAYSIYEDVTADEEEAYAESLADFYRSSSEVSDVSAGEVQSLTVGEFEVQYIAISLVMTSGGVGYEVLDIFSWSAAPNGSDCLEVSITEYNGSGDGVFIDPKEELTYAYGAVLGCCED